MNRLKMAIGAGLAALALVVAGSGYYHFHVKTDTPGFAIETVGEALEEHDVEKFHRAVNVDSVLDSGYEGFVEGFTNFEGVTTPDAKDAIKNFTQILRAPMLLSMKAALDSYVATGNVKSEDNAGISEIIERVGLNNLEIRNVKNVQLNDADRNEAFADVIIFQPELDREFPIQIILSRGKDSQWKITRVQNFQEYVEQINQARRAQLDDYLRQASEINSKHEATIRDAEQKYGMILSLGSLGQEKTRADLKELLINVFKKDWEERKQELFNLHVPKDAQNLHNLYMKICDLSIAAAQEYADWMDDNKSLTIKSAEEKIHQIQTLMNDAAAIARRMTS